MYFLSIVSFLSLSFRFDICISVSILRSATFSPVFPDWNSHINLQTFLGVAIKKPAKKSFRVLAGMAFKP
jgi:hypothetical protein